MCGIAGSVGVANLKSSVIQGLSIGIEHRGRDSDGIFVYSSNININTNLSSMYDFVAEDGVVLIHRRLSIIDLNERSKQPFTDPEGEIIITFNGEIYNYLEIRRDLERKYGEIFLTDSDTEVLHKTYKRYGINCFKMFNGFWAVSILDKKLNRVFLSRDYYGKKPLYLFNNPNGGMFFSSEITPLTKLIKKNNVNSKAIFDYLVFDQRDAYNPTLFDGISEVPPGTTNEYDLLGNSVGSHKYFEVKQPQIFNLSYQEVQEEYNRLLDNAISLRLRADVPIDINLSGGLDSSAIAVGAVKLGASNIGCHTFKFNGEGIDEAPQAKIIADSLGLKLDVINLSQEEIWNNIDKFIDVSEEPVHSPTTFVQQAAWEIIQNEGYKVILHGSGNDEFMAGYQYYEQLYRLQQLQKGEFGNYFKNSHYGIKSSIGRFIKWKLLNDNIKNERYLGSLFNTKFINSNFFDEMSDNYTRSIMFLKNVNNTVESRRIADIECLRFPYWNKLMDKNSMSIPIEIRMPFYDKELSNFVLSLSSKYLFKDGFTKTLLRGYIGNDLPNTITKNHIKTGFQTPDNLWMSKYKDKVISDVESSDVSSFIDINNFKNNYKDFSGRQLWRIYNFSKWYSKFIK